MLFIKQTVFFEVLTLYATTVPRALLSLAVAVLFFTPYEHAASFGQWFIASLLVSATLIIMYIFVMRPQPNEYSPL